MQVLICIHVDTNDIAARVDTVGFGEQRIGPVNRNEPGPSRKEDPLMSNRSSGLRLAALATAGLVLVAAGTYTPARADEFPSRLITLVVPYQPGVAMDFVARLLAQKLAESTKQNVVVENRPGASTNIGTEYVSRAAPDGHTVLLQAPMQPDWKSALRATAKAAKQKPTGAKC